MPSKSLKSLSYHKILLSNHVGHGEFHEAIAVTTEASGIFFARIEFHPIVPGSYPKLGATIVVKDIFT